MRQLCLDVAAAQSTNKVAEVLKCRETGVKQLTVPSLGLDVEVYCDNDWLVYPLSLSLSLSLSLHDLFKISPSARFVLVLLCLE